MPRLTAIRKHALDEMMKEALFEATVAVLSEHGVEGLTMDRVAVAAGVAKGSLYRYFSSKRDLVEFVYAKVVDPIFQNLRKMVAADLPAIEKLSQDLRVLLDHIGKHVRIHKLLFEDEAMHSLLQSSERGAVEAAAQQLAKIFRQGIDEGVFRPGDPLMMANMYLGLCRGVLDRRPELERLDQREEIHSVILDTLLNGIGTEKGRIG